MSKYSDFVKSASDVINTPNITTPTNNAINFNSSIVVDAFSVSENFKGVQDLVEYQLASDKEFTTILDSYSGSNNFLGWTPLYGNNPLTKMYIRTRHGSDNHLSDWSDIVEFTTADIYIETPVIDVPFESGVIELDPLVSSNSFNVINGTDTHVKTDWLLKDSEDNVVWSSIGDTTNLTSIQIPNGTMAISTSYVIEAIYYGNTYTSSKGVQAVTTTSLSAPVLTIDLSLNENATVHASYTSVTDSVVNISVSKGTISNHDTTAKTFDYTAPDITDALNTTDTISMYITKDGEQSNTIVTTITVFYTPIVADDAISNANYQTNEATNDGFKY